jgi:hypothetical protein
MKIEGNMNKKKIFLLFSLIVFLGSAYTVNAQEPMIGEQNGITWRSLAIGGTPSEALSRKTFYIDGLDNMSAFWSQHADLKPDAIDFNKTFIGMNVGQIRDGLDSFYVDEKNLQVPIIDAILIIRLQIARIEQLKVDEILAQFREATINSPDPAREKGIWKEALKLIK